ncbi:MAG: flagellar protein FlaG [Pseudomonas sp.]
MDIGTLQGSLSSNASVVRLPAEGARHAGSDVPAKVDKAEATTEQEAREPNRPETVEQAVSAIQEFVQTVRRNLNFDLDDSSGRVVVRVTDAESGEVIRQIPSEEALKLAENLAEARSLLFEAKA